MPRGDRTGPMGLGPMTGRGAGFCNGFAAPGYANPVVGFMGGFGGGFGRGRGYSRMFYANGIPGWAGYAYPANEGVNAVAFDEKSFLSNQAELLEKQLQQVKKRLSSLNEESE